MNNSLRMFGFNNAAAICETAGVVISKNNIPYAYSPRARVNAGPFGALHYMHYNFCRVHKTLRVTPAMEAGIADHVWSLEEVAALLDTKVRPAKRGPYKKRTA
jgi:hypothetical protein